MNARERRSNCGRAWKFSDSVVHAGEFSNTGREAEGSWEGMNMTIYELGVEYGMSATRLRGRIVELEQAIGETQDDSVRQQLEGRVRPLRVMYRETRAVARHLQGYYMRTGTLHPRKKAGD